MTIRIGVVAAPDDPDLVDHVREAERVGAESVWVPEYWAYDALSPLGALAQATETLALGTAIAQLGARSPAMLAMSAMSLQRLSGGRFRLGIGTSGPQVMEGWHGIPFVRPIARTRDTIAIVRLVASGQRVEYSGEAITLPLPGGEGASLRSAAEPVEIPIYVASLGPANLRLTGELADGWIGNSFLCESADVFLDELAAGAASAGRTLDDLDLTVAVSCEVTDDVAEAGRRHAAGYAFTFGAMGSAATNFYNRAFGRQGFAEDVAEVQRLWRSGEREAARARVPVEIGLRTNLIGPPDEIRRRLGEYRDCGIDTLRVQPVGATLDERLDVLGQLLDLARDV